MLINETKNAMKCLIRSLCTTIAVGLLIMFTTGCATLADAKHGRGTGQSRLYNAPSEKIWDAIPSVIKAVGLDYVEENRKEGYVLAKSGMTAFSYGENVAIFIEPQGQEKTRVEVVSKKAMATNVFAPTWSEPIFRKLDEYFR